MTNSLQVDEKVNRGHLTNQNDVGRWDELVKFPRVQFGFLGQRLELQSDFYLFISRGLGSGGSFYAS